MSKAWEWIQSCSRCVLSGISRLRNWLKHPFILGIIVGIFLSFLSNFFLESWRGSLACRNMVDGFIADIKAMKAKEAERLESWDPLMDRLETVDARKQEGGRPWLMPEAIESGRFVVFEQNASKLGFLSHHLAENIARFYAKSERLRAEIRLLTGPTIIDASRSDIKWLRKVNKKTKDDWDESADQLLDNLRQTECPWQWPF